MKVKRGHHRVLPATAWGVVAVVVLTLGMARDARAQASQSSLPGTPSIVVDGTDWMSATANERQAFLIGIGNLIVAEGAYAKRNNREMPPVSDRIVKAVANLKLTDIEARITSWYEAHPEKRSMPVMGVIWQNLVEQRP